MRTLFQNGIHILKLSGTILQNDERQIDNYFLQFHAGSSLKFVIDFTDVFHICSAAIGRIMHYKSIFSSNDGNIKLVISDEDLLELFEITMLNQVFEIHSTIEGAISSYI